jgi:hypothetical protein
LLIQAECARVSLILGSTAIFARNKETGKREIGAKVKAKEGQGGKKRKRKKQDFEEAMELYEVAIQSARAYGFTQYEVSPLLSFITKY